MGNVSIFTFQHFINYTINIYMSIHTFSPFKKSETMKTSNYMLN